MRASVNRHMRACPHRNGRSIREDLRMVLAWFPLVFILNYFILPIAVFLVYDSNPVFAGFAIVCALVLVTVVLGALRASVQLTDMIVHPRKARVPSTGPRLAWTHHGALVLALFAAVLTLPAWFGRAGLELTSVFGYLPAFG